MPKILFILRSFSDWIFFQILKSFIIWHSQCTICSCSCISHTTTLTWELWLSHSVLRKYIHTTSTRKPSEADFTVCCVLEEMTLWYNRMPVPGVAIKPGSDSNQWRQSEHFQSDSGGIDKLHHCLWYTTVLVHNNQGNSQAIVFAHIEDFFLFVCLFTPSHKWSIYEKAPSLKYTEMSTTQSSKSPLWIQFQTTENIRTPSTIKCLSRPKNNLQCAFDSVILYPRAYSGDQETYMTLHRFYRGIGFGCITWLKLHRALTPHFYNYQHPHSVRSITFLSSGNHTVREVCYLQWSFVENHRWLYCRVDPLWVLLEQEMNWIWFAPQRKMSVPEV